MLRAMVVVSALVGLSLSPSAAVASGQLYVSPDEAPVGATIRVHGEGFSGFSKITSALDVSVFPAQNGSITLERGSINANPDGTIDFTIDTSDGRFGPGEYGIMAMYTYWGPRYDQFGNLICSPCPVRTVPLADPISFVLD